MAVSALTTLIIAGSACVQQPTTVSAVDNPTSLDQARGVVLATVNDTSITLGDMISTPMYFVLLHQTLVTPEALRMRAVELGVVVTTEEIQEKYDEYMDQIGGFDQFASTVPESAPRSLLEQDLKKNLLQQLYLQEIMEIEFERQHGDYTDEEIQDEFDMNPRMYRNMVANAPDAEIEPEDVTVDMAREQIEESIKSRWVSNNQQEYIRILAEDYNIRNYALDFIEEQEDVVVPAVGENTFEMERVEEEHGSETEGSVDESPEGALEAAGG
jgi:hypothetical protein